MRLIASHAFLEHNGLSIVGGGLNPPLLQGGLSSAAANQQQLRMIEQLNDQIDFQSEQVRRHIAFFMLFRCARFHQQILINLFPPPSPLLHHLFLRNAQLARREGVLAETQKALRAEKQARASAERHGNGAAGALLKRTQR